MKYCILFLVACKASSPAPAPRSPQPVAKRELPPGKAGPTTHVVALAPNTPTPVMRGPFEIITINPGGNLVLGIAKDETCADVVWFSYSGGGAAVGEGEVLCARSSNSDTVTHGFSGH
jgi:hypothetical protein